MEQGDASEGIPAAELARVVEQLAPGASLARAWPLRGGISARMTVLELSLPGGPTRRVIFREPGIGPNADRRRAAAHEYRVLQVVRAVGVAAPAPLLLDESREIFPFPYLVVEFVDGLVEHSPADVTSSVGQIAGVLARIHRVDGTRPELASLPPRASWFVDTRTARPGEGDAPLGPGHMRAVLREAARRASRPSHPLPHPNPPALLHGDPWPGNMVWRDGRLVGMVDWESAHVGDPLEDLAFARFDLLCMWGWDAAVHLTRAYAAAQPHLDLADLPYWDLYAALRPVDVFDDWARGLAELGRPDVAADVLRTVHREFVADVFRRLGQ